MQAVVGYITLVSAARLGEVSLVKALLAKGFGPSTLAGMPEKKTPLEVAADQGSVSLVKVLLDAKASPNVHHQNSHPASKTALHSNHILANVLREWKRD